MAKVTPKEDEKVMKCFTFNVNMMIHIFAEDETSAREKLDKEGGFVGKRDVTVEDFIILHPNKRNLKSI